MKFAIINDMHIGVSGSGFARGVQRKLISESELLVKMFIEEMNIREQPDFVVNLGDSIEDVNDKKIDVELFKKSIFLLSELNMPTHTLIGNHDVRTLSENEVAEMLGYEKMYYSFDHEGFHFVVLSFKIVGDHTRIMSDIRSIVPTEQLEWLKTDLSKTDRPVILFIHYGLAEDDMKGNFWFEDNAFNAVIDNRAEVRSILEKSGNVKAVFNAHQHWNRMNVHSNIPYFTVTSLVENFRNDNIPSEAYTIVNLSEKKIEVSVRGNDPAEYTFAFA